MIENMSRRKAITYLLMIITIIVIIGVGPLSVIHYNYTAKSDEVISRESDPINVENNMAQMFDGVEGELKSVDLYVCNDMSNQTITFRLYDENHAQFYEQFYNVPNDFVAPGFVHIPVRYDIKGGVEYSFIIEGLTADLYAAYEDRNTTTSPVNYFMAYGGAIEPDYDLVVRYNYSRAFNWWQSLLIALGLIGVCALVWFGLGKIEDKEISIKRLLQCCINPVLAIIAVVAIYYIQIKKIFGMDTKNNLFLILGLCLLLGVVAIIINFGKIAVPKDIKSKLRGISLRRIIRVISIATVLWYCYEYLNGLYDISHSYSVAKFWVAFLFVLLSTYSKKEILNVFNAIWLVIGPIVSYLFVYKPLIGVSELEELYRYYGWQCAVGGFVIINIIYVIVMLARKKLTIKKLDMRLAIPFAILLIGLCVFANGRSWTWQLALACVLLVYRLCVGEECESFTEDLCSGIILNFYMMAWFSLKHRPYYFYQFYRYYMGFHTVTATAYYLSLVVSASFFRLIETYMNRRRLTSLVPKLFTFGMTSAYLIFTMSRTGFLAVGAMIVSALILLAVIYVKGNKCKEIAKLVVMLIVAVIYMFPATFFLQDVMPRLSNDPITFEYEYREFTFYKGMPLANEHYITIEQYVSEFKRKIFGIVPPWEREENDDTEYAVVDVEETVDVSNGRLDIFKCYIANWNAWGHDEMGVELPNGEMAVHAHNTFLQVAHDQGLVYGIYFGLFVGFILIMSLLDVLKAKNDIGRLYLPLLLVCFCMAGFVEWIFHLCNPFGLSVMLAMLPLLVKGGRIGANR